MEMESVKLAYFSPTGTTQSVVQGVAGGIQSMTTERIDITSPDARKIPLRTSRTELLVVGVPVYMGRVPALLNDWFNAVEAENTPTVCVVVYGNRVYDNALRELRDKVESRGCVPIAGAAYIGEHSFSDANKPVAAGRPNEADLNHAAAFGQRVREKLESVSSSSELSPVRIPGSYPYGGITELWDVDFITVDHRCTGCGVCARVCPTGAIDAEDTGQIDIVKCITCCACIKRCPNGARAMKPGPVVDAQNRLFEFCSEPKQPEAFL